MKVAILIPTLNRPSFIKRIVLYYDSIKNQHPIYIGDASNTEQSNKVSNFLKKVRNVKIKYFHLVIIRLRISIFNYNFLY